MSIRYIESIDEVIEIHHKTTKISGGGSLAVLDTASLECALEFVKDDSLYPSFADKLTHLFFTANKSHCFQDGNKRIAIALGLKFLLNNGYLFAAQRFSFRMEAISLHLAAGNINKELLRDLIDSVINEEDFSEELKLRLMNAISKSTVF